MPCRARSCHGSLDAALAGQRTGALRLEDVRGETLFIQIRNKSMLMNQKSGQRLVDDCVHPSQLQAMSSN